MSWNYGTLKNYDTTSGAQFRAILEFLTGLICILNPTRPLSGFFAAYCTNQNSCSTRLALRTTSEKIPRGSYTVDKQSKFDS